MSRRFAGGADFNGTSVNFVSNGAHSVCGWVRVVAVGGGADLVYGDTSGGGLSSQSVWLGFTSGGLWSFQEDGGTYSFQPAITLNAWTHLALTYDGTNCRAYINGALQNTGAYTVGPRSNFNWFDIGGGNGTTDFQAQDCFAFNTTLSAEDILSLMRRRKPMKVGGPYLWWPLGNDSPTSDFSGGGHTLSSTAGTAGTLFPPADWAPDNPTLLRVFLATNTTSVAGAGGVQSAANGNLSVAAALTGLSATHSAANGNVSVAVALSGTAGIQSAASGNVVVSAALAGASGVQSAANGNISVSTLVPLSGTAGIQSAANGNLSVAVALSGTSGVQSAATGNLAQGAVAGASGIQSAASGILSVSAALTGLSASHTAASATLSVSAQLTGASGVQSAANGNITVTTLVPLVGLAGIASAAFGNLSTAAALSGTAGVQSAARGNITGALTQLVGTCGIASGADATPSLQFIQSEQSIVRLPWSYGRRRA